MLCREARKIKRFDEEARTCILAKTETWPPVRESCVARKCVGGYSPLTFPGGDMEHPSVQRIFLGVFAVGCVVAALSIPLLAAARPQQEAQIAPGVVERGTFRLHKMEQPIGEETYEIARENQSITVKMDFKFTDRGTPVSLPATVRAAADLTPEKFEIKGQTSRSTAIDEAVEVGADKVRLRNRDEWTEAARPKQFFTIAGYAPAAMQMLLVRYWATHGSPAELETLPVGRVKVEPRGQDT